MRGPRRARRIPEAASRSPLVHGALDRHGSTPHTKENVMIVENLNRSELAYEWELTREWEMSHDCVEGRHSPSCLDVWTNSTLLRSEDENTEPNILRGLD